MLRISRRRLPIPRFVAADAVVFLRDIVLEFGFLPRRLSRFGRRLADVRFDDRRGLWISLDHGFFRVCGVRGPCRLAWIGCRQRPIRTDRLGDRLLRRRR